VECLVGKVEPDAAACKDIAASRAAVSDGIPELLEYAMLAGAIGLSAEVQFWKDEEA
jgi:hypothetical protein